MLPQTLARPAGKHRLLVGVVLTGVLLHVSGTIRAQDTMKTGSALAMVPADCAFFAASLRNKEQIDLFYNSKAYKTLRSLPLVKMAYGKLMEELGKEDAPLGMYKQFVADKENQELIDLLLEGMSEEIFIYGGKSWAEAIPVFLQANQAQSWGPLQALVSRGDPQKAQFRAVLLSLQKNRARLKIPELILGFKIKDSKKAENQLKRLEKLATAHLQEIAPLKGKVKRQKLGESSFLTLELDGSLIPWDDVNIGQFEEQKDEFADLLKQIKKLTLCVSLGVKDGFLMLGISSSLKDLEKLNPKGTTLSSLEELKPLMKVASRPLTGIGYSSKEYNNATASASQDYVSIGTTLKDILSKAEGIKEERKKAIAKDLDALLEEAKKAIPQLGAQVSYAYMTNTGYEAYHHDYGSHDDLKGVDCKLRYHLGGNPIFAAAVGGTTSVENYKSLVKWIKVIHGHAEGAFLESPEVPDEAKEAYKKVAKSLLPVWKRLDEITEKMLLPSIKETGLGLVIDGKWTSKQWIQMVPAMEKPLPMLELGLLIGTNDGAGFEKAITEYRKALNELYEKSREASPENIPEFKIPAPEREKGKNGTLIYYKLPEEIGLDKQVQPVAGVSKTVSVIALSKGYAERMMALTPLSVKSGPLSRKGPLIGLSILDWPALVDVLAPWSQFGLMGVLVSQPGGEADAKKQMEEIMKQVKVGLDVLKCFKGSSSATYLEGGTVVTHSEIIIKDLEK